ncbi:MAG: hypothetical protein HZB30_00060 [Nitrospirae bacterium]|nr:hypothetical protein [Nitrospirota bacterium]
MRKYILLNILLWTILFPVTARGNNGQERTINILYTGNLNGELEPCGCSPKTDFGGVARLSGYIAENRKALSPYLLIDAGNFAGDDTPQGRLKAETLLQAFSAMKYDLTAFQKNEMKFADDFLSSLIERYKIPVVSNTHHYKLSISKTKYTLNMHISADPGDHEINQLNILLTDLPLSVSKEMQGWDVIINSSGEILEEPFSLNNTIIVTGYPKGKKLGILTLHIDNNGRITGFKHRWQPLGTDIKEDKKVRQILNDYDSRVAGLLKETERPLKETSYLGVAKCAECHQPFIDIWKKTGHAKAFLSLEKAGKSSDPECLKCHTVGFGEEGGFYSIATTPGLANVQCEVCHGTGRDHLMNFYKPLEHVTEAVCLRCHTKDKSPDFSYKDYLEKVIH